MENDKIKYEQEVEHELFDVGLTLKAIHAGAEIIIGFLTLLVSPQFVYKIFSTLTLGELTEDPTDRFSNFLMSIAHNFSLGTKQFIAFYLLSHGIVNLLIVAGLFKKKMWSYKAAFIALTTFSLYQMYQYLSNHSIWLLVLTLFDITIIWLIWREYKRVSTI